MRERWRRYAFRGVLAGVSVAAGYYLLFGGGSSVLDVRGLMREERTARARVDSLAEVLDSLTRRADSLETDPAAIERTARNEYGLVRNGERVFFFEPPESPEKRDTARSLDGLEGSP